MITIEKGSVAIAFVEEALVAVIAAGHDPRPLLQRAGIDPDLRGHADARVPADAFGHLWLAITDALGDEFFGLDARRWKHGSFATLTHLTLHTRTLREALQRGTRLMNLLLDNTRVEFDTEHGVVTLRFIDCGMADLQRRRFAHETLFVVLHGLLCWLTARRIPMQAARFAYPQPPWWREYLAVYAGDVGFDAVQTTFTFDALLLEAPVVQTERSAKDFLQRAPRNFIVKYKNPKSLAVRIRRRLRAAPPDAWPGFETLAGEFGMSPSTLRRRLDDEGQSFRAIRDALRRDMAIRQLTRTQQTVGDIAQALGFAEPSAFHRAFRQWTGVSPGDYRRQSDLAGA
ncbi:AraC family transcriptional regulator [Solimonas marina]|uniref:AraC family transcriptional regulator n=1 Tax=Solimonas marina TaxID=2714601 RepID=A0A970B7A8_9GAMM|nr:AraC family transcriptional regulator [Solimonas marina]NKF21024.1 AraC family transcriptional regulator [Solimonas marina]